LRHEDWLDLHRSFIFKLKRGKNSDTRNNTRLRKKSICELFENVLAEVGAAVME